MAPSASVTVPSQPVAEKEIAIMSDNETGLQKYRREYGPVRKLYWVFAGAVAVFTAIIAFVTSMIVPASHVFALYVTAVMLGSGASTLWVFVMTQPRGLGAEWEVFRLRSLIGNELVLTREIDGSMSERVDSRNNRRMGWNAGLYSLHLPLGGLFSGPHVRISMQLNGVQGWVEDWHAHMTNLHSLVLCGKGFRVPMDTDKFLYLGELLKTADPTLLLSSAATLIPKLETDSHRQSTMLLEESKRLGQTSLRLTRFSFILEDTIRDLKNARNELDSNSRIRRNSPGSAQALDDFLRIRHERASNRTTIVQMWTPDAVLSDEDHIAFEEFMKETEGSR